MHRLNNRNSFPPMCSWMSTVLMLAATGLLVPTTAVAETFRQLAAMSPEGANSIVLLNMEKLLASPYGEVAGWKKNLGDAFRDGLARVPPEAQQVVITAQMDVEFLEPVWQAMLVTSKRPLDLTSLARARGASFDKVENCTALRMPTDSYVIRLRPTVVGAISPANRQWAVRWVRRIQAGEQTGLSPYLQQAAGYSDDAGSEIIMALDLDGAISPAQAEQFLEESGILEGTDLRAKQVAELLASAKGVRFGIRVGEKPSGMVVVDYRLDISPLAPVAKGLAAQWIDRAGVHIDDFQHWDVKAEASQISLSGLFSKDGLRRVLSVIESPQAVPSAEKEATALSQRKVGID